MLNFSSGVARVKKRLKKELTIKGAFLKRYKKKLYLCSVKFMRMWRNW